MASGTEKSSLNLTRRFKASAEKVWRAWTEPEMMKKWYAPADDFEITVAETDVRVGGRYRIVMRSPDGEAHDLSGVYREVEANRTLVFTWAWKSTPERESLVTVELRAPEGAGAGTEIVLTHSHFADTDARDRHNEGWIGCLKRLERYLQ